jgi:hypothetical protein
VSSPAKAAIRRSCPAGFAAPGAIDRKPENLNFAPERN